eukprot:TRINITY_DN59837_c0_g1_i1.p1 TRINITY_DN59837_c0_g1~~TRINITY_DN59837_c0_g1_i1.p1  ORF type:complete len:344 (-),score=146.32 TRINITY_DN59837_c0_g1_i1:670-1662(-)
MRTCLTTTTLVLLALSLSDVAVAQPGGQQTTTPLCATDGSSSSLTFDYTSNAEYVIVKSNNCPAHRHTNAVGQNPNSAAEQDYTYHIPKNPVWRNSSWAKNEKVKTALGAVGVALSGVALFGPATGPSGGDAGGNPEDGGEIDTFDYGCQHAAPGGAAHYHIHPYLLEKNQPTVGTTKHSPLLGFMPDGFPLYGINGDDGKRPSDLDACGGHSGDAGAGGGYHYHVRGPEGPCPLTKNVDGGFAYFANCLRGCVPDGTQNADKIQAETYAACKASASAAPSGSYITALNFSIGRDIVYHDYGAAASARDSLSALTLTLVSAVVLSMTAWL